MEREPEVFEEETERLALYLGTGPPEFSDHLDPGRGAFLREADSLPNFKISNGQISNVV